ncbi:hypothetical protein GWK47_024203 [Chionoecetes opilio]|uniref:Uncharacterized protein n=1 Tax=Chionoecetes opilio TaxID=41210 RepID=A0A8J4XL71_CHIOP|nr:hypothetical protein GWK47_024203 [Chionoecetes opilio]
MVVLETRQTILRESQAWNRTTGTGRPLPSTVPPVTPAPPPSLPGQLTEDRHKSVEAEHLLPYPVVSEGNPPLHTSTLGLALTARTRLFSGGALDLRWQMGKSVSGRSLSRVAPSLAAGRQPGSLQWSGSSAISLPHSMLSLFSLTSPIRCLKPFTRSHRRSLMFPARSFVLPLCLPASTSSSPRSWTTRMNKATDIHAGNACHYSLKIDPATGRELTVWPCVGCSAPSGGGRGGARVSARCTNRQTPLAAAAGTHDGNISPGPTPSSPRCTRQQKAPLTCHS